MAGISNLGWCLPSATAAEDRNMRNTVLGNCYASLGSWAAAWFRVPRPRHAVRRAAASRWRRGSAGGAHGVWHNKRPRRSGGCRTGAVCLIPQKNMGEPVGLAGPRVGRLDVTVYVVRRGGARAKGLQKSRVQYYVAK